MRILANLASVETIFEASAVSYLSVEFDYFLS